MADQTTLPIVAVLGGTGKEGSGLALRWALHGYTVIIGSRDAARAAEKAQELNDAGDISSIQGMDNSAAASHADIVVLSVPYNAHKPTLDGVRQNLAGKPLIDVTVPLQPPAIRTVHVPDGHAAALEAQAHVPEARVVAAFQNVSAVKLKNPQTSVDCDVLVCSDDEDAKSLTIELVKAAGMRGIDAGPLANAVAVEALTPVLLHINKVYGAKGAGIMITGIDD